VIAVLRVPLVLPVPRVSLALRVLRVPLVLPVPKVLRVPRVRLA